MLRPIETVRNIQTTLQVRRIAVDAVSEYLGEGWLNARRALKAAQNEVRIAQDPITRFGQTFEQASVSRIRESFLAAIEDRYRFSVSLFYAYLPNAGFSRNEQVRMARDFRASIRRVNVDHAAQIRVAQAIKRRAKELNI